MSTVRVSLLFATLIAVTGCATTNSADTPQTAASTTSDTSHEERVATTHGDRMHCRKIARVGTHMRSKRCISAADEKAARRSARRIQSTDGGR